MHAIIIKIALISRELFAVIAKLGLYLIPLQMPAKTSTNVKSICMSALRLNAAITRLAAIGVFE